jgi:hypothetical protein
VILLLKSFHTHHSRVLIVKPESLEKVIFSIFLGKPKTVASQEAIVTFSYFPVSVISVITSDQ